jgi:hypothetical protein
MITLTFTDDGSFAAPPPALNRPDAPLARLMYRGRQPLLPDGVRSFVHPRDKPDQAYYIYEEAPRQRLMQFRNRLFYIPVPWCVYVINHHANTMYVNYVFFRTEPLRSEQDVLYWATLPNLYLEGDSYGKVCTSEHGIMRVSVYDTREQISAAIDNALEGFWSSGFNVDITAFETFLPFLAFKTPGQEGLYGAFECWESFTVEEMLTLPYQAAQVFGGASGSDLTLRELLVRLGRPQADPRAPGVQFTNLIHTAANHDIVPSSGEYVPPVIPGDEAPATVPDEDEFQDDDDEDYVEDGAN